MMIIGSACQPQGAAARPGSGHEGHPGPDRGPSALERRGRHGRIGGDQVRDEQESQMTPDETTGQDQDGLQDQIDDLGAQVSELGRKVKDQAGDAKERLDPVVDQVRSDWDSLRKAATEAGSAAKWVRRSMAGHDCTTGGSRKVGSGAMAAVYRLPFGRSGV